VIVAIVSLDHAQVQSAWVELDLAVLGVDPTQPYVMHDLLTDARYEWHGVGISSYSIPPDLPLICSLSSNQPSRCRGSEPVIDPSPVLGERR